MGLYHKNYTPADQGFEAARHESNDFQDSLKAKQKLADERKKQRETPSVIKTSSEKELDVSQAKMMEAFNKLNKRISEINNGIAEQKVALEKLIDTNKEVHEEISAEEHEFVESVETENSGGNIMLDVIHFKHSDIVIVVGADGLTIFESDEDYRQWDEKKLLFDLEFEEMEKVPIDQEDEAEKAFNRQHPELNP